MQAIFIDLAGTAPWSAVIFSLIFGMIYAIIGRWTGSPSVRRLCVSPEKRAFLRRRPGRRGESKAPGAAFTARKSKLHRSTCRAAPFSVIYPRPDGMEIHAAAAELCPEGARQVCLPPVVRYRKARPQRLFRRSFLSGRIKMTPVWRPKGK